MVTIAPDFEKYTENGTVSKHDCQQKPEEEMPVMHTGFI